MPKRVDIKRILIIGAGPIVIGQACEFDYSGSQGCKALKEEGFYVVLVNSNPATIMTDPNLADATYIEPLTVEVLEKIIAKERPDAILPTLSGQTGLNLAMKLFENGVLDRYSVEIIGLSTRAIKQAEDRNLFRLAMDEIGLFMTRSMTFYSGSDVEGVIRDFSFPLIIRSSFTLGGSGGAVISDRIQLDEYLRKYFQVYPDGSVFIEESILGWKEYELELIRDFDDNIIVVCSIENLDPVGVHTGDSVTVAPQQTLPDREYQVMRDMSFDIIRKIGVESGGANIQFAVNPDNGRVNVIEMNPRVSRSSALASKATGYPIAKVVAKLAVGYTLREIAYNVMGRGSFCFEPSLDYCVVKIPRWDFSKFPQSDKLLTIQMKSVGEVMGVGRTFKEAFQKAICSMEIGKYGFENHICNPFDDLDNDDFTKALDEVKFNLANFGCFGFFHVKDAFTLGMSVDSVYDITRIDKFFLYQLKQIYDFGIVLKKDLSDYDFDDFKKAKQYGFSDKQISVFTNVDEHLVREKRKSFGVLPTYKSIDSCSAEFELKVPYFYSTYEDEDEGIDSNKEKIMIIGSGPNRIGQGIEFDYLCVQCSYALSDLGYETIMVNSNPETMSTDYSVSDKLYFEPITLEHILNIYEKEKPIGVIVQLGGQTPLNLARSLESFGVRILGTSSYSINMVEDRKEFKNLLSRLSFLQPKNDIANHSSELAFKVGLIGYPVILRPSYVLGGSSMKVIYDDSQLREYITQLDFNATYPILIDQFLQNAVELDADIISDGKDTIICGVMEHIEEAGVHSGDSAFVFPVSSIDKVILSNIENQIMKLASVLNVKGFFNIQFAIKDEKIYFLEVNLRGSRSIPFISKATGINWTEIASRFIVGCDCGFSDKNLLGRDFLNYISVKEVVFPFNKFPKEDALLGPEMKSTGEVMGIDSTFGRAFAKAQMATGNPLPRSGVVFISVDDYSKSYVLKLCLDLFDLGFSFLATTNTFKMLAENNIDVEFVYKLHEGEPNLLHYIGKSKLGLIVNITSSRQSVYDSKYIRSAAVENSIALVTTVSGFAASVEGIRSIISSDFSVHSLQDLFA